LAHLTYQCARMAIKQKCFPLLLNGCKKSFCSPESQIFPKTVNQFLVSVFTFIFYSYLFTVYTLIRDFISVAICVVQGLPKGWGKSALNTSVESPLVTNFMVYLPSGSTRTVIRCSTQPGHTKPMNRINRTVLRLIVKDTSLRNQCKWNKKGVPFGTPFTNETVLF